MITNPSLSYSNIKAGTTDDVNILCTVTLVGTDIKLKSKYLFVIIELFVLTIGLAIVN